MQKSNHRFQNYHIRPVVMALLTAVLLLSGCGDSSQSSDRANAVQSPDRQTVYYQISENAIPDPKTDFEQTPGNQGKNFFTFMTDPVFADSVYADAPVTLSLEDTFCTDGKLVFLYNILYITDDLSAASSTDNYCLYALDAPFEQWQCHILSSYEWATPLPDGSVFIPSFLRIVGASDDGVYLSMPEDRIVFYGWDGNGRLLEGFDTDTAPLNFTLYSAAGTLYAVSSDGLTSGSFTSYDGQFNPVLTQNLEHKLSGCLSYGSESLWYGFDTEQNLTVWDKLNGTALFSLGNMVNPYSEFLLTRSGAGEFILADVSGIWTGDGSVPLQKAMSFAENGYDLQEVLALSSNEDGSLSVVARFQDKLYLLILNQTDVSNRQEITLVSSDTASLEPVIAAFNRQSDKYRVILVNPFDSGDIDAYCRQIQLEISAGRGPDLVDAWIIDMEGCIQNGYIESLDDIIENPSEYWTSILESGKTNDSLYGLTYRFLLSFLSVSESLAGDLETWTLEQMMDAVRTSPAESLQMGLDSIDIVLQYGLADPDNSQFIDYSAGVSHLAEQPFLNLLEFAKKYGDTLYYADTGCEEAADYYQDGTLAAFYQTMYTPGDFLFASACFREQEVLIGMPAVRGRGIYIDPAYICLNSNSPSKAGAKEFLHYLMSMEGQLKFHQNDGIRVGFSCRRDVTELLLNEYQGKAKKNAENGAITATERWGVYVEQTPLNDEQIEQFLALFEDAKPEPSVPSKIEAIIREELEPYFAGDCTAEEAAGKLDNRVQLYFDERK